MAGIELQKQVSTAYDGDYGEEATVARGGTVWWRFTVTNTGNVDLENVTIRDDRLGDPIVIGRLAAGASHTVTVSQPGQTEDHTNVATVTADGPDGPLQVDDDARVRVEPAVTLPFTGVALDLGALAAVTATLVVAGTALLVATRRRVRRAGASRWTPAQGDRRNRTQPSRVWR